MNLQQEIEKIKSTMSHISQMVQRACGGKRRSYGESVDDVFVEETGDARYIQGKYTKLGVMILRLQDGELAAKDAARMEKWLLSDQHALKYYLEFNQLCSMLREMMGGPSKKESFENVFSV